LKRTTIKAAFGRFFYYAFVIYFVFVGEVIMKRFFVFFNILIVLSLTALAVSCASAPPPEPEPVAPVPPPAPVVEELPSGLSAEERYAALLPRVDAARQAALDAGAEEINPDGLAAADNSAALGYELADNGDYEAAVTNLEEAVALFQKAAQDAAAEWERRVGEAKLAADRQKAAADEAKAGNAAKTEYAGANDAYRNAERAQRAGTYREAIAGYEDAAQQFAVAAKVAVERRDAAAAVLLAAEKKIAESDELAAEVEQALLDEEGN
jgi:hypothetical protein